MAAATKEGSGGGEEADVGNPIVFFDITLGGEFYVCFHSLFSFSPLTPIHPTRMPPPPPPPRKKFVCVCFFPYWNFYKPHLVRDLLRETVDGMLRNNNNNEKKKFLVFFWS